MHKRPLFTRTRLQLLVGFLGVLTVVLVVFSTGAGLFFKLSLNDRYDRQLTAFAHAALSSIDIEGGRFDFRSGPLPSGQPLSSDTAVQWFDPVGRLLRATGRLPGLGERLDRKPGRGGFQDGPGLRSWVEPVYAPGGRRVGFLRVIRSLDAIEAPFQQLLWGLATAIPAALALSALGGWWLTGLVIQPVEDTFERLEQFTADAGHELRNPLMAIQTNCAVALKYAEAMRPGDRQKFLLIEDASRQLIDLVQELLKLARAHERPVDPQSVDMAALTRTLIEEYRPQSEDLGLALGIDCPQSHACLVVGKPVQLRCLLANLIENALKFTPGGGEISVVLAPAGAAVCIQVRDSGPGIAPEDLPHVFDRFWQADRARSRRQGTGLGLAIARSIVEAHGGTLAVTSTPDQGSTFEVRLPAAGVSARRSRNAPRMAPTEPTSVRNKHL